MKTFRLILATACAVSIFSGCSNMPVIDKEYNALQIVTEESSLTGTFRQGDEVAGAKIILSYRNGLGRQAEVLVPEVSGIYADPVTVTLASRNESNNGDGTVEITLSGIPEVKTNVKLRPTIRLSTHEVFITMEVTPKGDIVLDAAASTVSGTFRIFEPVQNGKISVNYNSTKPHAVSISVAEVVGVSGAEFQTTLPAAPDGGFVDVPLQGTPMNHGNQNFVVRMVREDVEYTMTKAIPIEGEITFDIEGSSVTGEFITGEPITDAFVTLAYTADRVMDVTVSIDNVDGVSAAPFAATLAAGDGTIEIPLTGTPTNDNDKKLVVTMIDENGIAYTAEITVVMDPGIEFVVETITFKDLEYKTVFVDVNGNGFATRGEVWLDRNIGATSNDPGTYGVDGANPDSFGHYYQFGLPYGSGFQDPYTINVEAMTPWEICPEGYRVPTKDEFLAAMEAVVPDGRIEGNFVMGSAGITETIMNSVLKLPMVGAWVADVPQNVGLRGFYWTSSPGSNTAPWRIELNDNQQTRTGANWSGWNWQHPVRCLKDM